MIKHTLGRNLWIILAIMCGILVLGIAGLFKEELIVWYARYKAQSELRQGAVGAARAWLRWALAANPRNGRVKLLLATCARRLNDPQAFARWLEEAAKDQAPPELVEREQRLAMIQAGRLPPGPDNDVGHLIAAGYGPVDVAVAFTYGALARRDFGQAWQVLSAWESDQPRSADRLWMLGVYWQYKGDLQKAEDALRQALEVQSRHELARLSLGEVLAQQDRWSDVLEFCQQWRVILLESELGAAQYARALRALGDAGAARELVAQTIAVTRESPELIREMGEIYLELGMPQQALQWFAKLDAEHSRDRALLHSAALALSWAGESAEGFRLMEEADRLFRNLCLRQELRMRLAINPGDQQAIAELSPLWEDAQREQRPNEGVFRENDQQTSELVQAWQVYREQCAACHGENGSGDGPAARFLFPRPRNLRHEAFRIVGTDNAVPSAEDVALVIRYGMPGTAMRQFNELPQEQILALARLTLELRREGVREQLTSIFLAEGADVSEDEIEKLVEIQTDPGARVTVPADPGTTSAFSLDGAQLYDDYGCDNCHGKDGTGCVDLALWDDRGFPNPPRNLAFEPFKGGRSLQDLYLRIRIGMPGTAHPACPNATPAEITAIAAFCLSLKRERVAMKTNYERWCEAAELAWLSVYESGQ